MPRPKKGEVKTRWTAVQHSGMGYKGDTAWAKALEARQLNTLTEQQVVLKAGGKLFDSWKEAEDYCEEQNYGTGESIYCNVPGTFSDQMIDGLKIYIPPATVSAKK